MGTTEKHFLLYANCIPVKGASRSTICDTQRNGMYFISNSVYDSLKSLRDIPYQQYLESVEDEELKQDLIDAIGYLEENELGFWTEDVQFFPELDLSWDHPGFITNAIIDEDDTMRHNYSIIFPKLEVLGCRDVQVRIYRPADSAHLQHILQSLEKSSIRSVEIFTGYNVDIDREFYKELIVAFERVKLIAVHSANVSEVVKWTGNKETNMGNLLYTEQVINGNHHCGIVDPFYFELHMKMFLESQQLNSCLNRKVGIDTDGSIKNCPSLQTIYGNIYEVNDLESLIRGSSFRDIWHISKNQVDVCKDCEFRYVCVDCRAFLEQQDNPFSKPGRCNYNPYEERWMDEEG
jgi:SPASM domain peptide maturase of grasp-with-spasm system